MRIADRDHFPFLDTAGQSDPSQITHPAAAQGARDRRAPPDQAFAGVLADDATIALVALDDHGEPLGFSLARIAAAEAELLLIAVALPARRQSNARRLLDATIAEATRRAATSMFLEVDEHNAAAIALYAAAGFAQVGRRKGYYRRGTAAPTDALLLARRLDGA